MIERINDNGNLKIQTDTISYILYRSKDNKYELKELDNKKFIVIKTDEHSNILNQLQEYHSETSTNDWNLVNSMIKLKEALPQSKYYEMIDKFYIQDNKIFELIESELNKEDINNIIEWCQEYGLPFLGESGIEIGKNKSYKWFRVCK